MDLTKITSVIRAQLAQATDVQSLQLQNHIYGCFLLMEDIAQNVVEYTGQYIKGDQYVFHLVNHFSQIGVRYGFIMDAKAILSPVSEEYKAAWLELFHDIRLTHDIELVDRVEDAINDVIQTVIPGHSSFFVRASITGSLPPCDVVRVLAMLHPDLVTVETELPAPTTESQLPKAKAETAMHPSTHRRFSRTRRNQHVSAILLRKGFARTRRNHHNE
jgi:hypothetical protein